MPLLRADDGVEIVHETWGVDDGRPPVVLHHGFSSDAHREWVDTGTVAALLAAGRRVLAVDARGHGRSGKPHDPASYGEARMAADLRAVLDAEGLQVVDLAGYSMGAVVALLVAAADPRVRRLVVGGVGAGVVELGGVDRRVLDPLVLREALLADDPSTVTDPTAAGFRAGFDATGADRRALAAQAAAVHRTPVPLDAVTAPTLVVAGRDDALAARPEVLAAAIPGAQLLLLDGDHPGVVASPAFREALVDFLEVGPELG
ncbi:MAG: alpha/beta hydrolase [Kineosporiaceae bacterium]